LTEKLTLLKGEVMNIIIVGCGMVGRTLAAELNEEGNNITVVDLDPVRVNEVAARYDILGVVGNGATIATLREAGIDSAHLLIAVTGSDELNLLCCLVAKKNGSCQTIARLENPEYSKEAPYLKDELGLAMVINPQQASAREIARILRFPSAISIETFARGRVELLKFKLPEISPLVGMAVREVVTKLHSDILVCTVERGDDAFIANGDFIFESRDIISIVASPKAAADFFEKIKYKTHSVKDAIIVGGGEITHYLCDMLRSGIRLKVIEKDRSVCEELSTQFEHVSIINGDGTDQELLKEEGFESAGALISLTDMDEENIMLSLYAKNATDAKLITKVNRVDYADLVRHLELDSVIYPKNIASDVIIRYVRAMRNTLGSNVENLYNFIKGKVEACEFIVKEPSPLLGVPLSKLKFKKKLLIAAILRDREVIIPRGSDSIQLGDTVVVVSESIPLTDITDILKYEA
jgi:trk system potassium uptake protein TrkA